MTIHQSTFKNPRTFWKDEVEMFPVLSAFAKQFLLIAGSSTAVERLWSLTRDTLDPKRSNLSAKTLAALILLKGHLKDEDKELKEIPDSKKRKLDNVQETPAKKSSKKRKTVSQE